MNIFIDGGANDGNTIEQLIIREPSVDLSDTRIIAFEPNPKFIDTLRSKSYKGIDIEVHEEALWIEDGEKEFAVDQAESSLGSTLMNSKFRIWDSSPKIKVKTIDFSEWIKQFRDDTVIVKFDIEGAEFPILKKMIEDKTVGIIDKLWIEFHPNKVRDYKDEDEAKLKKELKKHSVRVRFWEL